MYIKALVLFFLYVAVSGRAEPNIVIFLTDDQDFALRGMTPMKNTNKLIADPGTVFLNNFVATPVCCPSRSSLLTGTYIHNHHAINNSISGGCSSPQWQNHSEPLTFASLLKQRNYTTFYAGKYLNEYGHPSAGGVKHVPPGWDVWRGLVGNSRYYNFTLSFNGKAKPYHNGEYLTDVIKDEALAFIKKYRAEGSNRPFLMMMSPPAPHAPFTPAPRHKGAFKGLKVERAPNFNIPIGQDRHWLLRMSPEPFSKSTIDELDDVFRARWETLLAVDELVRDVVEQLSTNDTYFIFTSDNGYHIGQFSLPPDKRQPYETDLRVPLVVRGPGVESGLSSFVPTVNVDLAPTILKIAGIPQPDYMDGTPLPIFQQDTDDYYQNLIDTNDVNANTFNRHFIVEYHGEGSEETTSNCSAGHDTNMFRCLPEYSCKCQDSRNNTFGCVRHLDSMINFVYCSFNETQEFEEAYDLNLDPFQLKNIIGEMLPAIKFKYQNILAHLSTCKGRECNAYNDRRV